MTSTNNPVPDSSTAAVAAADATAPLTNAQLRVLLGSVFIIAACSLLYELLISSLSTYLLGSSVVHYSLTIGLFLFFMGVGAWVASFVRTSLTAAFVAIEMAIGVVGGLSAVILFATYVWTESYYPVMLIVIAVLSTLIGMEIPLLTRMVEKTQGLRKGISEVLSFDYLGALLASLLFPFVLLPYFGHLIAAMGTGLVNLLVALFVCWYFRESLGKWRGPLLAGGLTALFGLLLFLLSGNSLQRFMQQGIYQDTVIHNEQSRYQNIVVTRWGDDVRLYLDGSLQFSSIDEYRYHELLVHAPAAFSAQLKHALVIGGGDGLAVRELLRYQSMESITLVELDPAITRLTKKLPALDQLSQSSLKDSKVELVHQDAWDWLAQPGQLFDLIIIDLPDPDTEATARLYTSAFYKRIARRLSGGGVMITQATSPWFASRAYWSIGETLEEVFDAVRPASVYVPSFGPWGFFIAANHKLSKASEPPQSLKFLTPLELDNALNIPADFSTEDVEPNHIGSLPLLRYYAEGWDIINKGNARP